MPVPQSMKRDRDASWPAFGDFLMAMAMAMADGNESNDKPKVTVPLCVAVAPSDTFTMSAFMQGGGSSTPFGGVVSTKDAAEAGTFVKSTAFELKSNLMNGNWSLRALAILGGFAMIVVSILGFISHLFGFNWISAIFDVYTFFLGIMIVVLEAGTKLSFFSRISSKLYRNAKFLTYLWGRGIGE